MRKVKVLVEEPKNLEEKMLEHFKQTSRKKLKSVMVCDIDCEELSFIAKEHYLEVFDRVTGGMYISGHPEAVYADKTRKALVDA